MDLNKLVENYKKKLNLSDWPDYILYQDLDYINGLCSYIKYHLKNRYYYFQENKAE